LKKISIVIIYLGLGATAFVWKDHILHWLENGDPSSLPYIVPLTTLLALVPVVPFGVISGMMGAKFGAVTGGVISAASSTIAAVLMFLLVRYAFRDSGRQYLRRSRHLDRFIELFEKNPFISILFARLIPIIPAAAVNMYSAISKVSLTTYVTATLAGKVPVMFVFAIIGDQLLSNPRNIIMVTIIYAVFLGAVYWIHRWLVKVK
jgi:uncharacterized membrane protein YdjX (TVP38/TMEM64 family)